ncbi:alkanesulfonate monooxygenase [Jatrophihabitans sp. GAS493]|uniref:LLM class flavin-dependent oxidoreductase n=1 Tax=Jatrophihabitans sp. GAS493 TaxID=1907575 RepID=UPI000BBFEA64|nr:LLM class flavin-dependent oxidoreductase [Jatrophihabitans sp. GAS493]SOD72219.1 alkanesulfonate monooxygenase [Jatrophihabitans sp. GAS493]
MTKPVFHWFLPTGGDGRQIGGSVHGLGIGATQVDRQPRTAGERPAALEYLSQVARAADQLGYEGVLTPTGAHCEDAWVVTAALIAQTTRLKFLVAFRPGLIEPALAAHMAATFQRLSAGRLLLNVVAGSSDAEQRSFGDPLSHDARYDRAEEFLAVVRQSWAGLPFDHHGQHYDLESSLLREPPDPQPLVYLGGSSEPALELAGRQADTYLTWGEPPVMVAEKVQRVRDQAARHGRTLRFGLRIHVISRDTAAQAWRAADDLIAGLSDEAIAEGQRRLRTLESVGQGRMLQLHGGSRDRLVVARNLWAGIGLVRGGAGTALVGSHDEVAERIAEYQDAGIDEFILSGYPHLEEAYSFAEGVVPLFASGPATVGPQL